MPAVDIFLKRFFEDLSQFQQKLLDEKNIAVTLRAFSCDAPVRSVLKNIVSFSGYSSCERCIIKGLHVANTMVFTETNCLNRTDHSFSIRSDPNHHKSNDKNILECHEFPMVTGFVLDEMHLIYIGVVKRILSSFFDLKLKRKNARLGSRERKLFDQKLEEYQHFIPCEFNRKLEGGLSILLKWKATQFRMFALYLGVAIFNDHEIFRRAFFVNFLNLFIALRLLNSPGQYNNTDFMRYLLVEFINGAKDLYGTLFCSYNVHCLVHTPDDYDNFGPPNLVSCFSFESYLGSQIKSAVRAGFQPLKQIASHIQRENANVYKVACELNAITAKPFRNNCSHDSHGKCIKKIQLGKIIFKSKETSMADSVVLLKSGIVGCINFIHKHNNIHWLNITIYAKRSYFLTPIKSDDINIFKVKPTEDRVYIQIEEVAAKMFILPFRNGFFIAIPLMHFK